MKVAVLALCLAAGLFAGGLRLEITSSKPNTLTAKVVACKSPASSTVVATVLFADGKSRPLTVKHPAGSDTFTVEGEGEIPAGGDATIELRLSNPEFGSYQPRYLVRYENGKPQLTTIQRLDR